MVDEKNLGKISSNLLEKIIFPKLGIRRDEVLVGPAAGVDTCVIKIGSNEVLVASSDPLSLIPDLGPEDSAWMSVNLLVNDLSTSGLSPQYLIADLNLPPNLSNEVLARYWNEISDECSRLGIAIVGGNTGKFDGCDLTIVGAGTAFAVGSKNRVVVSSGANIGDSIILTKGAAISTIGILSKIFPNHVRDRLGESTQKAAEDYFGLIPSVNDALTAVSVGTGLEGVSAMHDVAEGGVFSALIDLAGASSLGMKIQKEKIPISEETISVCKLFGIDPYISLGEGALVITCSKSKSEDVVEKLAKQGIVAAVIGETVSQDQGVVDLGIQGDSPIIRPKNDPYWNAYANAVSNKWN
jgi:hydrogenase expression/formation protein HypE